MSDLNTPWHPVDYQNGIEDNLGNQILFSDLHDDEKKFLCDAVNNYTKQQEEIAELKSDLEFMCEMSKYDAFSNRQYKRIAEIRAKHNKGE